MANPIDNLPLSLLVKLGSIAVHAEEFLSGIAPPPSGSPASYDLAALRTVLGDREVVAWLEGMGKMALLPVKR